MVKLFTLFTLKLTRNEAKALREVLDQELGMSLDDVKDSGRDMGEVLVRMGAIGEIHRKLHKTKWWSEKKPKKK